MLDPEKLFKAIQSTSIDLFKDISADIRELRILWDYFANDTNLCDKLRKNSSHFLLPSWQGKFGGFEEITSASSYQIIAVDGSQVYPDRHQGISCYLINIGIVTLSYGEVSSFHAQTEPYVFSEKIINDLPETFIDAQRQELELNEALQFYASQKPTTLPLVLFDGSLIFWHLQGQSRSFQEQFLTRYLSILSQFKNNNAYIASYISMPKSKELINVLRLAGQLYAPDKTYQIQFENLLDVHLVQELIPAGYRTRLFKNNAAISKVYPPDMSIYFFYLVTEYEIGRVEIPEWLAHDSDTVNIIASIIMDQINKGYGYPISLAEAHGQAVVKNADRELFYQLISQCGMQQKKRVITSLKSAKKRKMAL